MYIFEDHPTTLSRMVGIRCFSVLTTGPKVLLKPGINMKILLSHFLSQNLVLKV